MKSLPKSFLKIATSVTITCSSLTTSFTLAQETTEPSITLNTGSLAPAFEGIDWIQGEPIQSLDEKGKVYMLELWATWCGPCIQIIPHIDAWHKKYQDKGLEIIGLNIFEDNLDTVKAFVKAQGEQMNYRVAFSGGRGSAFEKNWLIPAGIQSIPHALLIKDGKIIFKNHPGMLDEATLESMLSDDFDAEKYAAELAAKEKEEQALRAKVTPLFEAQDWDGIIKVAQELKDENPAKLQLLLTAVNAKSDWKALTEIRAEVVNSPNSPIPAEEIDKNAALGMKAGEGAEEYALTALKESSVIDGAIEQQIPALIARARLQFLSGDKASAEKSMMEIKQLSYEVTHPQFKAQLNILIPAIETALRGNQFPSLQEILQSQ
jgi:thiol-disulfide isomerase/thioredoxin